MTSTKVGLPRLAFATGRIFQMGLVSAHRSKMSGASFTLAMIFATSARAAGGATGITGVTGGADAATMLNNIATFILGPFGQSLAVLAIIGIGLAWMFGRVSLGLIAGVIGGIIIMFGASYLASTLTTAG